MNHVESRSKSNLGRPLGRLGSESEFRWKKLAQVEPLVNNTKKDFNNALV